MVTSSHHHVRRLCLAPFAAAALLALSACSPTASTDGASIRFAMSTTAADAAIVPTVRVREVRVLSNHVNLQEPVLMGSDGDEVTITFAHRRREGETLTLEPTLLEPRAAVPHSYPAQPRGPAAPLLAASPSNVVLDDGSSLSCWTDTASSRVLVQAFDPSGAWRGAPVAISPDGLAVYGAPHVATPDGRHVVVAFFASDEERFQLVAASLERTR
jgi:hypothetical protein